MQKLYENFLHVNFCQRSRYSNIAVIHCISCENTFTQKKFIISAPKNKANYCIYVPTTSGMNIDICMVTEYFDCKWMKLQTFFSNKVTNQMIKYLMFCSTNQLKKCGDAAV